MCLNTIFREKIILKESLMSDVRKMIEAIAIDDFDGAREALKVTLADYMTGRAFVSNSDLFGKEYNDDYKNPNVEDDLRMQAAISGGRVKEHDKVGVTDKAATDKDYATDVTLRKKDVAKRMSSRDLGESVKAKKTKKKYAVVDTSFNPIDDERFDTEKGAQKHLDSLSSNWWDYVDSPDELLVDEVDE